MAGASVGTASPSERRHPQRMLRHSTLILPRTGERVRRVFSLPALGETAASQSEHSASAQEQTPLLLRKDQPARHAPVGRIQKCVSAFTAFALSKTGLGIFKCSLAYVLGSLATFVPAIAALLGKQDGKHIVATITVYFHPARSVGSMHEATILALIAFLYAATVSFTSMGISMLLGRRHLLVLGHAIVLIVFCGGGLGFVAWIKQRLGNPLVNVACSLASLAIISILTKEGSVQVGTFSEEKVAQVLKMVILGVACSSLVNLVVKPISARKELCKDMTKSTDLIGDLLVAITRAFLSGNEVDMDDSMFKTVTKNHKTSMNTMKKDLGEAKWEHFLLGTERQYRIEARIVECLQRISQNLGGLRSAALTQFSLIKTSSPKDVADFAKVSRRNSLFGSSPLTTEWEEMRTRADLHSIDEVPEDGQTHGEDATSSAPGTPGRQQSQSPADMFTTFILQLGPPTKSLAYTVRQILDDLPFEQGTECTVAVNANFHTSLRQAIDLYKDARREALATLYRHKDLRTTHSLERVADLEEVAASCGHFSFALLDFAEETLVYLDILEELKTETEHKPRHRSWNWLKIWKRRSHNGASEEDAGDMLVGGQSEEQGFSQEVLEPIKRADAFANSGQAGRRRPWTYRLYRALRAFRRDDVKFAIKVGIGAALFALPAFLVSTRPIFSHWRGEWGLVSYMVVCSMTIGASNTTGVERFIGTGIGALCAILAWVISDDNPWLLGFFGWLVSLGCFYLILGKGKGPMGRFILLTYNLSALYSYSLSVKDDEDDDDEGGVDPEIWEIVLHRTVAVIVGALWGIIITRLVFPISARRKLKNGLCLLWLRMSLIWKRDPLAMFLLGEPQSAYMDIREEADLQNYLQYLESLRKSAASEFELRGPFPNAITGRILERTGRMLDNFHAMNVVISKDLKASPGEAEVLRYTRPERFALSGRISHLFSVLASSIKIQYPLNDVLPDIEHTRDRLLAKIFEFRRNAQNSSLAHDQDYELLYAYALVTGQLAQDIAAVGADLEELYGTLNEDSLKLQ